MEGKRFVLVSDKPLVVGMPRVELGTMTGYLMQEFDSFEEAKKLVDTTFPLGTLRVVDRVSGDLVHVVRGWR